MKYEHTLKYGALHVHSVNSIFDAVASKEDIIKRIADLGGQAVAITDHGVLFSAFDDMDIARKLHVKIIYGVEAYVEMVIGGVSCRVHCILMATDNIGVKAINKAVTESNRNIQHGFPLMTNEILNRWFGDGGIGHNHVIATSACIQGILGTILSNNDIVKKNLDKAVNAMDKLLLSFHPDEYEQNLAEYNELDLKISEALVTVADFRKKNPKITPRSEARQQLAALESQVKVLSSEKKSLNSKVNTKAVKEKYQKYLRLSSTQIELKKAYKSKEEIDIMLNEQAKNQVSLFGKGNFFIELQNHGLKKESLIMPKLAEVARNNHIPVVAANDAHMVFCSEKELKARRMAQFSRNNTIMNTNQDEDCEKYEKEFYIKDDYELSRALLEILPEEIVDEAMNNVGVIVARCFEYGYYQGKCYPVYDKNVNADEEIRKLAYKGIEWRFPNGGFTDDYKNRLEYELKIISQMGYSDYHLIVQMYLEVGRILGQVPDDRLDDAPLASLNTLRAWYDEESKKDSRFGLGLGIGEGRGSAAGSLVCYLLGITGIDPLKFGLLFERFLNPARQSMPDIDSDFSPKIRDKCIDFCRNVFGNDAICCIATKSFADKNGAIRLAGRYLDALDSKDIDKKNSKKVGKWGVLADKICKELSSNNADELNDLQSILEYYSDDSEAEHLLEYAHAACGIIISVGVHAAGVIIAGNGDVSELLPLRFNTLKKVWTTFCDAPQAEHNGVLKMDFLGLKTLAIITDAIRLIYDHTGRRVDIRTDPFKNEAEMAIVFDKIYRQGNTMGVFQYESPGMKSVLKGFQVADISTLIMINALYRPGPMDSIPDVLAIKNGAKPLIYDDPRLEPILKETYGHMIYQEQVMRVCQALAGYSFGEADNVRRYMSKKKMEKLQQEEKAFIYGDSDRNIVGCIANGVKEAVAKKIFAAMIDFAKYAFNKSHAAIYAITSFYTAWIKCFYPIEFYTALFNHTDETDKLGEYIKDAKRVVKILPPDINISGNNFTSDQNVIYFGLGKIKGFKAEIASQIIDERKKGCFLNFADFLVRTKISDKLVDKLIKAGAFDRYGTRSALSACLNTASNYLSIYKEKTLYIKEGEFFLELMKSGTLKTLDDFKKIDKPKKFSLSLKNIPKQENVELRIKNALKAKEAAYNMILSLSSKAFNVFETTMEKEDLLKLEKELLGFYVSSHPYLLYNIPKDCTAIVDATVETSELCGIVTNLRKSRKGTILFNLEDSTGIIPCVIFPNDTQKYDWNIKENVAYYIKSKSTLNSFNNNEFLQLILKSPEMLLPVEKKREEHLIHVKNIRYLMTDVYPILKKYETNEATGIIVRIYDETFCTFRVLKGFYNPDVRFL